MVKFIEAIFQNLNGWGFIAITFILRIAEFSLGLYGKHWNKNERFLDIACYTLPKLIVRPVVAYFGLKFLPLLLPYSKNTFEWIPFFWGALIIAIYDDLTQYWYHRLHHEIPWLWRFHHTITQPLIWVWQWPAGKILFTPFSFRKLILLPYLFIWV